MTTAPVEIGAEGVDVRKIVEEIRTRVAEKLAAGHYADPRIARAERMNLANLRREDEFLQFYFAVLRESFCVDINDFEITERRKLLAPLLVTLKRCIWKLLKFYTYRLWSQQNQINGLLLSAIESAEEHYRSRLRMLEQRLEKLEKGHSSSS
ncbi:MAG: hypothetical protein N2255_09410 [Kiritimatiellae bacterium]|nr:hypothetical protein [Kiritimatiellia bacterium]